MRGFTHARGVIALRLAKLGLRVHPLHPGTKKPVLERWQERATTDESTILTWWSQLNYNIGIATGAPDDDPGGVEWIGFDYDCKGGKPGLTTLAEHTRLGLTDTLCVRTGSGGVHALYWRRRTNGRARIANSVEEVAPGVDVRGWHGYLVSAGSEVDGKVYEIVRDVAIKELPPELEALAVRAGAVSVERRAAAEPAAPVGELDQDEPLERARRYLTEEAPIAVEGAGGDNTTYAVAARVKDFGVSEERCLELLLDLWNGRCAPPWDVEDLEVKVRNAYKYGRTAPGGANAWVEFEQQIEEERERYRAWPRSYNLKELQELAVVPLTWIVKDFLVTGVVNGLFGDGGVGKDMLLMQLGIAMAVGAKWLGRAVTQGKVLYFPAEDTTDELRRREAAITAYYQTLGTYQPLWERFRIVPMVGEKRVLAAFVGQTGLVDITEAYKTMCNMIEHHRPDLVIVGNRVNIFSVNQNDDAQAAQCLGFLTRICTEYRTTVIMPSHVSLAGLRSGTGTSGSVQWSNGMRQRLYLRRIVEEDGRTEPDVNARVLETMKANWSATGQTIAMRWHEGLFVPDAFAVTETEAEDRDGDDEREVMRLFDELPAGIHVSPKLKAPNSAIGRFARDGKFMRMGRVAGRRRVETAIERLIRKGTLQITDEGVPSRRTQQLRRVV